MIVEHVVLDVQPGREQDYERALAEGLPIISSSPGFRSLRMIRGVESPSRFVLLVEWDSVEAHEVGFRLSDDYKIWKELLHHFYVGPIQVEHFNLIAEVPNQ